MNNYKMSTTDVLWSTLSYDPVNSTNATVINQMANHSSFDDKILSLNTSTLSPQPTSATYNHFEDLTSNLNTYVTPIIIIGGTIGNILSVMVFLRTKLKKLSSSYYLACLTIFDTGFLWCSFIEWLNLIHIELFKKKIGFCKLFTWLSNSCSVLSVWLVVAFTIERFVAVMYPLRRQYTQTVRRARFIVCILMIFNAFSSAPLLLFTTTKTTPEHTLCVPDQKYVHLMGYYNYYDFFVSFFIPLALIVSLNTVTAFAVWKPSKVGHNVKTYNRFSRERSVSFHGSNGTRNRSADMVMSDPSARTTVCRLLNGHQSIRQSCLDTHRLRYVTNATQIKVTKMLLVISTVYVLLNLPSYVLRVIYFISKNDSWLAIWQHFAQFFFLCNFGINFVLYCLSGQNFRKELMGLFRRNTPPNRFEACTHVTSVGF